MAPGGFSMPSVAVFLMYFCGTFLSNPLKPLLHCIMGSPYSRAYKHFRSAHSLPFNIGVHLLGLITIVIANFALMHEADIWLLKLVGSLRCGSLIAATTAVFWSILLMCTHSPVIVRAVALALIGVGYVTRAYWRSVWISCLTAEGVLHALILQFGDAKAVPTAEGPPFLLLLAVRYALQVLLMTSSSFGCLAEWSLPLNVAFGMLLAYGSSEPFSKHGWRINCYWAGYVCWIFALLTDQAWLYFYGTVYVASLMQGVAHRYTGEAANLPELAMRSGPEKAADEHAHTTFFPCLILHAAYDTYTNGNAPKSVHALAGVKGRILITGCAGRIGRFVTEYLVTDGVKVRGFDRQKRPASLLPDASAEAFEYVQGDLQDAASIEAAMKGCEIVCHFAAVPDDADFEKVLCPVNILGLHKVLEACRKTGVERLIVASSGKIFYHRKDGYPIMMDDPPKITCNYGATKLFLEGATEVFANDPGGCPTIVLRFAWCPFARPDVEAMTGCMVPGQGRDEYMSGRDCSRCVRAALSADLGSRRFVKLFCQSNPPPGRPARFDLQPTKQLLGWEPIDTFPTGIDLILNQGDYVKNPDLKKRVVAGEKKTEAQKDD